MLASGVCAASLSMSQRLGMAGNGMRAARVRKQPTRTPLDSEPRRRNFDSNALGEVSRSAGVQIIGCLRGCIRSVKRQRGPGEPEANVPGDIKAGIQVGAENDTLA